MFYTVKNYYGSVLLFVRMKMNRLLSGSLVCLLACALSASLSAWQFPLPAKFPSGVRVPSLDETYPNFVVRDGNAARLERVFAKGLRGEPIVVAVIGGSITAGAHASRHELQWGAVLADWFRHAFPKSEVTYVNAGIGATGSNYAVHRVEADVCAKNPDVVGVEFAVNDSDVASATETDEGLIRHLLNASSHPFVFQLSMMAKGCVNRMARHLPVSEYYDIPHFSYRNAFFPLISAGKLKHTDLAKDELHPDSIGHPYVGALVGRYLDGKLAAFKAANRAPAAIPPLPSKPLVGTTFDTGRVLTLSDVKVLENKGFRRGAHARNQKWAKVGGLMADKPGSRFSVEIDAPTCALLFFRLNGPMGRARVSVDGREVCVCDAWFAQTWGGYTPYQLLWRDKPGKHVVTVEVLEDKSPDSTGHTFEVDAFLTAAP